jgi:nucleoside permease NupC
MMLAINVIAMLIAFLALLALVDYLLGELATGQSLGQTLQESDNLWRFINVALIVLVFYLLGRWLNRRFIHFGKQRPLHRMFGMESRPRRLANHLFVLALFALFVLGLNQLLLVLPRDLQLKTIFGAVFSPLAFLMGVPLQDAWTVGNLLGIKLTANEFLAFDELTRTYNGAIQRRSFQLATYALTGFANFGSVGIQIGGIGALAPSRRSDLARLGIPAMFIGFLATVMNAALAGVFMGD